jgi:precorrin-6B methylase 2
MLGGTPVYGVPPVVLQEQEGARDLIYQASQATEQAWEEFHAAAIGGTLASPEVQSRIERLLHEARALLMEARKAERDNQFHSVETLTQKIQQITQNIVQASREKKQ